MIREIRRLDEEARRKALQRCGRCGHEQYHHRPDCSWREWDDGYRHVGYTEVVCMCEGWIR